MFLGSTFSLHSGYIDLVILFVAAAEEAGSVIVWQYTRAEDIFNPYNHWIFIQQCF